MINYLFSGFTGIAQQCFEHLQTLYFKSQDYLVKKTRCLCLTKCKQLSAASANHLTFHIIDGNGRDRTALCCTIEMHIHTIQGHPIKTYVFNSHTDESRPFETKFTKDYRFRCIFVQWLHILRKLVQSHYTNQMLFLTVQFMRLSPKATTVNSMTASILFLWSPYGIGQTIIFSCCGLFFLLFFLA